MPPRRRRRSRAAHAAAGTSERSPSRPATATRTGPRVYAMDYAHPILRMYAMSVDLAVVAMLFTLLNLITQGKFASPEAAPQDIFVFFGYFILFTGIAGQTPGKFVAGIVVVDREGRVPGIAIAIPREMIGKFVSAVAVGVGFAWILFDPGRQGWHDKIAGTYVVRKADAGVPGILGKIFRRDRRTGGG